jgi:hypothetical protein
LCPPPLYRDVAGLEQVRTIELPCYVPAVADAEAVDAYDLDLRQAVEVLGLVPAGTRPDDAVDQGDASASGMPSSGSLGELRWVVSSLCFALLCFAFIAFPSQQPTAAPGLLLPVPPA